jgi:hypothetical protein
MIISLFPPLAVTQKAIVLPPMWFAFQRSAGALLSVAGFTVLVDFKRGESVVCDRRRRGCSDSENVKAQRPENAGDGGLVRLQVQQVEGDRPGGVVDIELRANVDLRVVEPICWIPDAKMIEFARAVGESRMGDSPWKSDESLKLAIG